MIRSKDTKRLVGAYVHAYTSAYGALWGERSYRHTVDLYGVLTRPRSTAGTYSLEAYIGLHCVSSAVKKEQIERLLHEYELVGLWSYFCSTVIDDGNGVLLIPMICLIIEWYEKKENIVHAEVGTAQVLLPALREELAGWVYQLFVGADVRITYTLCPALIAGVRVETKDMLIEYSVRRQLYGLSQLCKHEGIRWQ